MSYLLFLIFLYFRSLPFILACFLLVVEARAIDKVVFRAAILDDIKLYKLLWWSIMNADVGGLFSGFDPPTPAFCLCCNCSNFFFKLANTASSLMFKLLNSRLFKLFRTGRFLAGVISTGGVFGFDRRSLSMEEKNECFLYSTESWASFWTFFHVCTS